MEKTSRNFDEAIENFLNNIESLRNTLPEILKLIERQNFKFVSDHGKFLKDECEYIESEGLYRISPENNREHTKLKKAATQSAIAHSMMSKNFLISLVSQFDTYIGELMNCVFEVKPDIIDKSERQLSFSQLRTFSDVADARRHIIEKEVESVLRESHTEQFNWFEKKLDIKLTNDLTAWKSFIELTQRRNLFVHNNGKVTSQYLNVCQLNHVTLPKELIVGDKLDADIEYLETVFNCLFEIGLKLTDYP